jgi:succinate-semialdehyde dehydrogenase / glutarate-semialdehyde dehydrogenase
MTTAEHVGHTGLTRAHIDQLLAHADVDHSAESVKAIAPFAALPLADLPQSSVSQVTTVFAEMRSAQPDWARLPVGVRAAILLRFHDLVLAHRDASLDIVQWETGKARAHAAEEWLDVAINARYYGRIAAAALAPSRRSAVLPLVVGARVVHHAKGVVGVVSPWNYPLTMAVSDALPALVAGNTVVLRPDNKSALSALWLVSLLRQAGLPRDVMRVVLGDGPTIGRAVADQADHVMFTGSTSVGREVAARCAARLASSSLELGGKNPMVILEDADLDRAVEIAVRASTASAGQLCVSIERVLVHGSIYDEFVSRFVAAMTSVRMEASLSWEVDMGSLISAEQVERVSGKVDRAIAAGARLACGGRPRPDIGPFFYEPTVLLDAPFDSEIWREETFGPVVTVHPFMTDAQAVALANDSEYGLNASVVTRSLRRGRMVGAQIRCGTVNINEGYAAAWGSVDAPMGGMKSSGLGRRHGVEGLLRVTEPQTIATQRLLGFGRQFGLGHEGWIRALTTIVRAMKVLRLR